MLRIKAVLLLLLVLVCVHLPAQNAPDASKVLSQAKTAARTQNKNIVLLFGASWCVQCKPLEELVEAPAIRSILDQHFVISHLAVGEELGGNPKLNNPGSLNLLMNFGGIDGDQVSLPYIVLLDAKGKAIANSRRPVKGQAGGENIGYPSEPEEIAWFMSMLQKGAPALTEADAKVIRDWLEKHQEP